MKLGDNEMDTVKGLMSMSLFACLSEALKVEIDEIEPHHRLIDDLKMTADSQGMLVDEIADMFDGVVVSINEDSTVDSLLEQVVAA